MNPARRLHQTQGSPKPPSNPGQFSPDDRRVFADCCCVAMAITADGAKVTVGLWYGGTEITTVVKDLVADLVTRGLRYEQGILVVIDGAKALAAAVKWVSGGASAGQEMYVALSRALHYPERCITPSVALPRAPRYAESPAGRRPVEQPSGCGTRHIPHLSSMSWERRWR